MRTTTESPFRRFRLNQWVAAEHLWLPAGLWEGQADPDRALDPRLPLAVGIDPAYSDDTFAIVVAQRQGEDTVVRARFYINPYPPTHSARADWVVDHEAVRGYLRELRREFPVAATRIDGRTVGGPAFVYDPSSFTEEVRVGRDVAVGGDRDPGDRGLGRGTHPRCSRRSRSSGRSLR